MEQLLHRLFQIKIRVFANKLFPNRGQPSPCRKVWWLPSRSISFSPHKDIPRTRKCERSRFKLNTKCDRLKKSLSGRCGYEKLSRKDDTVPTANSLEPVSLHWHRSQESEGGRGKMEAKTRTLVKPTGVVVYSATPFSFFLNIC